MVKIRPDKHGCWWARLAPGIDPNIIGSDLRVGWILWNPLNRCWENPVDTKARGLGLKIDFEKSYAVLCLSGRLWGVLDLDQIPPRTGMTPVGWWSFLLTMAECCYMFWKAILNHMISEISLTYVTGILLSENPIDAIFGTKIEPTSSQSWYLEQ